MIRHEGLLAIALAALSSCATPGLLEQSLSNGEPVYRCALAHTVGRNVAEFDGYFRADGSPLFEPNRSTYALDEAEPELVSKLDAYFGELSSDPKRNCTLYEKRDEPYRQHGFDCSASWSEGGDTFHVSTTRVGWSRAENGQRVMSLGWSTDLGDDFAKAGFPWGETLGPILFVERPDNWRRANGRILDESGKRLIEDFHHETGEIRSGDRYYRKWSASNVGLTVPWEVWPQLHEAAAPIEIILHDSELDLTRRFTLSPTFPRQIEARLQSAYADLKARERNPVNQCKRTVDETGWPEIILVH